MHIPSILALRAIRRRQLPALLATGFGSAAVVAYWTSVGYGLFGVGEVSGGWPEESAESAVVVIGTMAAITLWRQRISPGTRISLGTRTAASTRNSTSTLLSSRAPRRSRGRAG